MEPKKDKKSKLNLTVQDYYLIRKTIAEMLYDRSEQEINRFHFERGSLDIYNMIPFEAIEETFNIAKNEDVSYLNFSYESNNQQVYVCFLLDASNMIENIRKFKRIYHLTASDDEEILYRLPITENNHLIIILGNKERPVKDVFQTTENNCEIFWYKSLTFNVAKHMLVPKHSIISEMKKEELKKIYFLDNLNKLPTILKEDPVAKYYGMRNGDVCQIVRENPNIGVSIMYRYVSDI